MHGLILEVVAFPAVSFASAPKMVRQAPPRAHGGAPRLSQSRGDLEAQLAKSEAAADQYRARVLELDYRLRASAVPALEAQVVQLHADRRELEHENQAMRLHLEEQRRRLADLEEDGEWTAMNERLAVYLDATELEKSLREERRLKNELLEQVQQLKTELASLRTAPVLEAEAEPGDKALDVGARTLGESVRDGDSNAAQIHLSCGASPNERDAHGLSLLMLASVRGDTAMATLLLDARADIQAVEPRFGMSALHVASNAGSEHVVRMLLEHAADVHALTSSRETAVHRAARAGHVACVRSLLRANCSAEVKTQDGSTALAVANKHGHSGIVDLLLLAPQAAAAAAAGGFPSVQDPPSNAVAELSSEAAKPQPPAGRRTRRPASAGDTSKSPRAKQLAQRRQPAHPAEVEAAAARLEVSRMLRKLQLMHATLRKHEQSSRACAQTKQRKAVAAAVKQTTQRMKTAHRAELQRRENELLSSVGALPVLSDLQRSQDYIMDTLEGILDASSLTDADRVQAAQLRRSLEDAAARRAREQELEEARAAQAADTAQREAATRMVCFYTSRLDELPLAEDAMGSSGGTSPPLARRSTLSQQLQLQEPRLDAYYAAVAPSGLYMQSTRVSDLYVSQESNRTRILTAHGLGAWLPALELHLQNKLGTPAQLRGITAADLRRMAAMIRPALRMDASKVEEALGAIRRAAQAWLECQRQSRAWRPTGPVVMWAAPVEMVPIPFQTV